MKKFIQIAYPNVTDHLVEMKTAYGVHHRYELINLCQSVIGVLSVRLAFMFTMTIL